MNTLDVPPGDLHFKRVNPLFFPSETTIRFTLLVCFLVLFIVLNIFYFDDTYSFYYLEGGIIWVNLLRNACIFIYVAFFPVVYLWYFLEPIFFLRRENFKDLSSVSKQFCHLVKNWAIEMGNIKQLKVWIAKTDPSLSAEAFGTSNKPNILISMGAWEFFKANPGSAEVIIRHEISHLVSKDSQKISFSQKAMALFPVLILAHFALRIAVMLIARGQPFLFFGNQMSYMYKTFFIVNQPVADYIGIFLNLIIGLLLASGIRAWICSMQRAREKYAYYRAGIYTGFERTFSVYQLWAVTSQTQQLTSLLRSRLGIGFYSFAKTNHKGRLFLDHPQPKEVASSLKNSLEFFEPNLGLILTTVLLALMALGAARSIITYYSATGLYTIQKLNTTTGTKVWLDLLFYIFPCIFVGIMISAMQYLPISEIPKTAWRKFWFGIALLTILLFFEQGLIPILSNMTTGQIDLFRLLSPDQPIKITFDSSKAFVLMSVFMIFYDWSWARLLLPVSIGISHIKIRKLVLSYSSVIFPFFILIYLIPIISVLRNKRFYIYSTILSFFFLFIVMVIIGIFISKNLVHCPNCGRIMKKTFFRFKPECENCGFHIAQWLVLPEKLLPSNNKLFIWHGLVFQKERKGVQRQPRMNIKWFSVGILLLISLISPLVLPSLTLEYWYQRVRLGLSHNDVSTSARNILNIWSYRSDYKNLTEIISSVPELQTAIWGVDKYDWFNAKTADLVYTVQPNRDGTKQLWALSDQDILVSGMRGSLVVWNVQTNSMEYELLKPIRSSLMVAINKDKTLIAAITVAFDNIVIWDRSENYHLTALAFPQNQQINSMTFSPDGKYLIEGVSGYDSDEYIVIDLSTKSIVKRFTVGATSEELVFSKDGTFFGAEVVENEQILIRICNIATGETLQIPFSPFFPNYFTGKEAIYNAVVSDISQMWMDEFKSNENTITDDYAIDQSGNFAASYDYSGSQVTIKRKETGEPILAFNIPFSGELNFEKLMFLGEKLIVLRNEELLIFKPNHGND
jgi:hypothetical protein